MRNAIRLAVAVALSVTPTMALAQSSKVAAEALFEEGRRLMASSRASEACPKFEASQHLDPSPSTLLNLGNCYEKTGRKASAWATYKEAASAAYASRRSELVTVAQKRASAIESHLSTLSIVVSGQEEGLEVRRGGVVLAPGAYGVAIPVDGGTHLVEARAPKKKTWSTTIEVKGEDDKRVVNVPALEDDPEASAATTPPTSDQPSVRPNEPTSPPSPALATSGPSEARRDDAASGARIGAWVALGLGAVGTGVAVGFAVAAKDKYDTSLRECPRDRDLCSARGVELRDDARTLGDVATAATIVAGVAVATGLVVYLLAPSSTRSPQVGIAPSSGGALLTGRW